eukprot:TRINITY_DN56985_c0_g1_i1.p1 TRINITY_DN56985_c0_g1~~TRINITY_DN56985_c0_g1_i1.p1  ORF type:complete len:263 (-),score=28.52 TRINITY_DN56985_c0_g1_i1:412-1086(-)
MVVRAASSPQNGSGSFRSDHRHGHRQGSVDAGRLQRGSIPGYAGFVPGRKADDVLDGFQQARPRHGKSPMGHGGLDVQAGSMERGSLNCTVGVQGDSGPACKTASLFHNPRGQEPRAGGSIPGYSGFVPGRIAENTFGKRFAMDNIHATQVRHGNCQGKELTTNWLLHAENDRKQKAPGAASVREVWSVSEPWRSSRRGVSRLVAEPGGWTVYEPRATNEFLRY